jgi:folate-binding protein YgfZ
MSLPTFYSQISVQGLDSEKFLQGQLTCDLKRATLDQAILGAHCNPKGRILSLFFLTKAATGFDLFLPSDLLDIAYDHFKKYGQFFKQVVLKKVEKVEGFLPFVKNLDSSFRWDDNPRLAHIEAGLPLIYAATSGLFLPHDINLPQLGGVSFDKGCYTGQEIVARMQNLGRPKQHLYQLTFDAQQETFAPGNKIYASERLEQEVGMIVDVAQKENQIIALASLKDAILMEEGPVWNLDLIIKKTKCLIHILKLE